MLFHELVSLRWAELVGLTCTLATVYLALCPTELHSKQHGLTPSVQFWDIYCGSSPPFNIFLSRFENACWLASTFRFAPNRSGCRERPRSDHAHALHSISDQFQREEIPALMKCDVWQSLFPHWSNWPPHLFLISQPDLVETQKVPQTDPEREICQQ